MAMYIKKSMSLAIAIGLLGSSIVMAGSIRTFHQSWLHSGGQSYSGRTTNSAVQYHACRPAVVKQEEAVARGPDKSKATSATADEKSATAVSDRTADKATGLQSTKRK